jgi:hypothetical protein
MQQDQASNETRLIVDFVVDNPNGYRGFTLRSFDLVVYFIHQTVQNSSTLFKSLPLVGSQPVERSLGPDSKISSSLTILLYPDQSVAFQNFNKTSSGRIVARAFETVELITFLDPVVGRIRLDNQEDLQLP